ncbi:MAG TPA: hypothetical protein DCZ94_05940 [Lentisphaeria bacterium]|nr:MAG: hypothetical protein A2X48_07450 [Lentisphaerae bacterium GWF2_49_21]HBC86477.1 hypothetical protein [Lentisphaeria bacterium]
MSGNRPSTSTSNIPEQPHHGWTTCKIDDICRNIVGGGTPSRSQKEFWDGQIPWATVKDFTDDLLLLSSTIEKISQSGLEGSSARLVPEKTPVICTRMAVGRCALTTYPTSINQDLKAIFLKETIVPEFFIRLLRYHGQDLERVSVGTTVRGISLKDLRSLTIKFPTKTLEQVQIATVLNMIDESIACAEAVIAKLKNVRAGMLHDLLTRGLDKNGQLRPPPSEAPKLYKDSPLGKIPKEWEIDTLVSRITFPEGQVDPRNPPYSFWPLIAPDHIEPGTGCLISRKTALELGAISGKYIFEPNDVIYSKIRPYLRKATLATERGLCSADMYPLRPISGVNSTFLLSVLLGESFSRFASAVSMRSGFPKINRNEMREFVMGWPSSEEQEKIASSVTLMDKQREMHDNELSKLHALKTGLSSDLLTGKARVPGNINRKKSHV